MLNRRRFLAISAGALGLAVSGRVVGASEAGTRLPMRLAVTRFAYAVGSERLANSITEYVGRRYIPFATEHEVNRTNSMMAQDRGHFTDLSWSTVYSPESYYFFYTARSEDGLNTCVAFFDRSRARGDQNIALIEGPTLIGIGCAADEISRRWSTRAAKQIMLPRHVISRGAGAFDISYAQPDVYESDEAEVQSNYRTYSDGRGLVTVRVLQEDGPLLERTYAI